MYIEYVTSQSSAEGGGVRQPGRKTASLLIVFATSVSESSLLPFSFGRQNEAKLQVFAVPMAAKRGSWDNFPCVPQAALWGPFCSICPLFARWCSVCACTCVTVTLACLLCLASDVWGQDAGTRAFSVCWKLLFQLQAIPVYLVCLLASFPCLLLEGGEVLIRVEMS